MTRSARSPGSTASRAGPRSGRPSPRPTRRHGAKGTRSRSFAGSWGGSAEPASPAGSPPTRRNCASTSPSSFSRDPAGPARAQDHPAGPRDARGAGHHQRDAVHRAGRLSGHLVMAVTEHPPPYRLLAVRSAASASGSTTPAPPRRPPPPPARSLSRAGAGRGRIRQARPGGPLARRGERARGRRGRSRPDGPALSGPNRYRAGHAFPAFDVTMAVRRQPCCAWRPTAACASTTGPTPISPRSGWPTTRSRSGNCSRTPPG